MSTIARYAATYGGLRILPALFGLGQVALLAQGLGTEGYGQFVLLTASAGIVNVVALRWAPKAIARFSDQESINGSRATALIVRGHLLAILFSILLGILGYAAFGTVEPLLIVALAASESIREANLERARASLKPRLFAAYSIATALLLLLVALYTSLSLPSVQFLALLWLVSILAVNLPPSVLASRGAEFKATEFRSYLNYGLPIALSGGIGQFAFSGIRLLLGFWHGAAFLGQFALIYDLTQRTLVAFMQVVHSAAFPLIRRAWDSGNRSLLHRHMQANFLFLVLPTSLLLAVAFAVWPDIASVFGISHSSGSDQLAIMIIGIGVILNRLRTFHIEPLFLLAGRPRRVLWNTGALMLSLCALLLAFGKTAGLTGVTLCIAASYAIGLIVSMHGFCSIVQSPSFRSEAQVALGSLALVGFSGLGYLGRSSLAAYGACTFGLLVALPVVVNNRHHFLPFLVWRQSSSPRQPGQ